MNTGAEQWVEHEFANVALGDTRLEQTARRVREHGAATVLLLQDTTYFDFAKRAKAEGLDQVGRHGSGTLIEGLMLHNTLACDPEGLPLGLLDQRFIDRRA